VFLHEGPSVKKKTKGAPTHATRRKLVPAVIDANQRYDIEECAAVLRESIAQTFLRIRQGRLAVFNDGRRTYCSGAELIRASRAPEQPAARTEGAAA
jgi:hypothetical protein